MQFKGVIRKIGETITGQGQKGEWSKTPILVEEISTQYPNSLVFDAFNKNIDNLAEGMVVEVDYNGKANEYNGKMYNSLLIWKIEAVGAMNTNSAIKPKQEIAPIPKDDDLPVNDDLPF